MSKAQLALQLAFAAGYRVNESGEVLSPTGRNRALQWRNGGAQKYAYFGFSDSAAGLKKWTVAVHRLAAYQKYGSAIFDTGIQVRHRDGCAANNRPDNILIGSPSDNAFDMSVSERQRRTELGAACVRAFTAAEIRDVRQSILDIGGEKTAAKYGVASSTISMIKTRKTYNWVV